MDEFNIISCEPKETLIECLNDCSIDNLKAIGIFYNIEFNNKNKYINYLKEEIIKNFKDTVIDLPYYIYKEFKDYKNTFLVSLIKYGFMFHYHKENDYCINVIPKEIKDIFNKYIKEHNNDYLYILTQRTILYYLTINSYIPKEILEKIILSYKELGATKEKFNKAIKELGVLSYKNNYTALSLDNVKKIEGNKYNISYNMIDLYELSFYDDVLNDLVHTIYYLVNVKENDEENKEQIVIELLKKDHNNKEFIDFLKKQYHINQKKENKIEELLNESTDKIKYWNLNGRSYDEYISEIFLENGILNELPKKTDMLSCLENLNEDGYELIKTYLNYNGDSKEELKEEILKSIDEIINCYPKEYLKKLLEYNNNYYDKFIRGNLLLNGFVYLYLDDDIKVLIPDEVIEYLNNSTQEKLDVANIINIYIKNNGVIDIDILVKLINDNHNLNINKEDIFEYSKKYKVPIIDNKYISFFANLPKSYVEQLLLFKNTYKKYKKLDIDVDYTQDFLDVTDTITDNLSELDKSIIASSFIFPLLNGSYNKIILKEQLKQNDLLKYYNSLDLIANKFKNKIGIWSLNGYTLKDNINVSKKVGRNDPCPCGSGKKYKKCCGK